MGEVTGISWTDHTFNPWWGCTKVSEGCDHCYAETLDVRYGGDHWGPGRPRRFFPDKHWNDPLTWNGRAHKAGEMRKVFCASMADVFDTDQASIAGMTKARERLWQTIRDTPNLIWQILTKRPVMYWRLMPLDILATERVWKGFSAENQETYDKRWPHMRKIPGVRWLSYEPALGPLTLEGYIDWVICGGESGRGYRPMSQSWAETLRKQCSVLNVPFFMKQMSATTPIRGKLRIPSHLQIQEFPR